MLNWKPYPEVGIEKTTFKNLFEFALSLETTSNITRGSLIPYLKQLII